MAKNTDTRLGQLLIKKKLCTLRQINEALLRQKDLRGRDEYQHLGRILRDRGLIDEDSLCEALAELGTLQLICPVCRTDQSAASYVRGAAPLCPRCNERLVLNDLPGSRPAPSPAGEEIPDDIPLAAEAQACAAGPGAPPRLQKTAESDADDENIGRNLKGCVIREKIAQGGMGAVYKAEQLNLRRIVAVKILAPELASDENFRRRFKLEAKAVAKLSHGNIIHINDVDDYQGIYFYVMEYVKGRNLKEILKDEEKLDVARAVDYTLQVCRALSHAHQRDIIHRDIKPENIMITEDGIVKLADLGLAKTVSKERVMSLTHAGAILGTPFYMAPEQAKDFSRADKRSDIYSLGVTLYRMLAGRVPFDGRSPIEVLIKASEGQKTPLRELRSDASAELEVIVNRMMHRDPEKRYQDVEEVIRELSRVTAMVAVPETT